MFDLNVLMDNESIFNIAKRNFKIDNYRADTINRLIAQKVSAVTSSMRFNDKMTIDMNGLVKQLVPYA
jgi:hypothetical protein